MFQPHLLILAAHVFMHVTITPLHGKPTHIGANFPTMAACRLAADEIIAASPLAEIGFTCTKRYEA